MNKSVRTSSLVGTRNEVSFEPRAGKQTHPIRISSLLIGMIAYVPLVVDIHERVWSIVNCQPEDGDIIRVDNTMHTVKESVLTHGGYISETHKP